MPRLMIACLKKSSSVVVAMSGGVDSSVVAAELASQGYDVVGVTLQLYDHGAALAKKGACCAGRDIHDARRVADLLEMPFYAVNFDDEFGRIVDYFVSEYTAGRTPNPCLFCNPAICFCASPESERNDRERCCHQRRCGDGDREPLELPRGSRLGR